MKKLISLIKAAFTQDMSLFSYTKEKNASKTKRVLLPIALYILIVGSFSSVAFKLIDILKPLGLSEALLAMFWIGCVFITFTEAIYKSQGMLFGAKDNDLLFSLPITKKDILFVRIFKIFVFEILFNSMFILPAIVVYGVVVNPSVGYYLISLLAMLLLPILPMVVGCLLGYLIKLLSTRFKKGKIVETFLTLIVFTSVFFITMNTNGVNAAIQDNAANINNFIIKYYYPINLYISLINQFNILDFIILLGISIIPLILFIIIGQKYYFMIINKQNRNVTKKNKEGKVVSNKPLLSLTRKEIKRYFSSPVYIFNTGFSMIFLIIITLVLCIKGKAMLLTIFSDFEISDAVPIDTIYYAVVIINIFMASITSSSISLEGKTINFTKSLPIKYKTIFDSKILNCIVIELPVILLSIILYTIFFKPSIIFVLELLIISIISLFINAVVGLLVNLKYPKLNASSDTEVVKQSMSAFIGVLIGICFILIIILELVFLSSYLPLTYLLLINIVIFLIIAVLAYNRLITRGPRKYLDLNV